VVQKLIYESDWKEEKEGRKEGRKERGLNLMNEFKKIVEAVYRR
jgi:hypothetical protein